MNTSGGKAACNSARENPEKTGKSPEDSSRDSVFLYCILFLFGNYLIGIPELLESPTLCLGYHLKTTQAVSHISPGKILPVPGTALPYPAAFSEWLHYQAQHPDPFQ